ncbi:MAG: ABC transporter permease [Actinomycetota bacterium]|nr:ABC transporter permease [Actinomycetota bacterium]
MSDAEMPQEPPAEPGIPEGEPPEDRASSEMYRRVTGIGTSAGRAMVVPALAVLTALIIGAFIIAVTDVDTLSVWGDDPAEAFRLTVSGIFDAYRALLVGSVGSLDAISETLFAAAPMILAGLAVAVGFQAGLFNIGVNGQMHIGGMAALWVGFTFAIPAVFHVPLVIAAAIAGGALWAALAGFLKARTGAHEVITTIMLNFIALFLVDYLLKSSLFQAPGRNDPISQPANPTSVFVTLFSDYRLNIGFIVALLAVAFVWWLMYRTTIGFEFRAVGYSPSGGRYAGMSVAWVYVSVMAVSGALAGIAGANQVVGLEPYRGISNFAGNVGFDAIALALLGRSHPVGVLFAGLLFGGLRAGGREMQGAAGIPIDLVLVLQALIIVMIAAPELVRAIYRVKTPDQEITTVTSTGWGA